MATHYHRLLLQLLRHLHSNKKAFFQSEHSLLTSLALDPDTSIIPSQSPSMQSIYHTVEQVAKSDSTTVLIEGESGTGKDVIANMIHKMSARHNMPMMEINCASLPEELFLSLSNLVRGISYPAGAEWPGRPGE